jgi:hypothetical protein
MIHAREPLSAAELQEALAVKVNDKELDEENIVKIEELLALCAGLVTVDDESSVIRLIHYTTDKYFKRSRTDWLTKSSECIASTCLTYLSFG